ncbi:hypothetical protein JRO89_XS13G0026600 [Xanthoceras sorbifolium]|uniref:Amidase domain-containing protein n=1 Tax=Xanthoceras sorbifolium TaxID=99658 RepID=A0ABQ8H678_9ROSI|nr:hypothetical protein JRO89_XS13G0026600 [Xanthoceras sorbifolium]
MASSHAANLWVLLGLGLAGILLMTKKLKKSIREDFGAFIEKLQLLPPPQPAPPKAPHPLTSLTFAVSDVFDIEGYVTGFGHPDWARTHEPASRTATVVSNLVEGGATCVGKTIVDELAYRFCVLLGYWISVVCGMFVFSINGTNKHYGTPTNPAAHSRVPGGSSSGAAVAVAAKLVDFSLGVDTVGGVRVPAAFCGIMGFRSSHGAVSQMGIIPVATSLDTVGWFARDPNILRRVGHVLLHLPFAIQRSPRQIIIADDCFELLKIPIDRVDRVLIKSTEKLFGRQVLKHENLGDYFNSKVPSLKGFHKTNGELKTSPLRMLANVMRLLQRFLFNPMEDFLFIAMFTLLAVLMSSLRHEFKHNHEDWINSVKPTLDAAISAQVHEMLEMDDAEIENCKSIRNEMRVAINSLLKDDGLLVIPTTGFLPPKLGGKELLSEDYQNCAFSLLSISSISGCCQVTVPLGQHDKCPISVSFIARHGGDRFLLDSVQSMYASLQEQADIVATSKPSANAVSQEQSAEIAKEKLKNLETTFLSVLCSWERELYFTMGNQAYKDKQLQKAIGYYTEAIKLNGNNATYYSNRAAAHLEQGSFLQAEADCTKAINLDKKNVKAYLRRGTAREMLGYYKEAIEGELSLCNCSVADVDFSYALVLEPTNKRAYLSADRLRKVFM